MSDDDLGFFLDCHKRQSPIEPPPPAEPPTAGDIDDFLEAVTVEPSPELPLEAVEQRAQALQAAFPDANPTILGELAAQAQPKLVAFILAPERTPRERSTFAIYLRQGFVTKQDCYQLGFDPVVTRDLTKHGVVFESHQGRILLDLQASNVALGGPAVFPTRERDSLIEQASFLCALCGRQYPRKRLALDHRVPHRVAGNSLVASQGAEAATQVLCYGCNNDKQHACRDCPNQQSTLNPETCESCFWAYPEAYCHVATTPERRAELAIHNPTLVAAFDKLWPRLQTVAARRGETPGETLIRALLQAQRIMAVSAQK